MIKNGILNPQIASLLARTRHTNALVIADRAFPCWPDVETVDVSLVDNVPTVLEVVRAIRANWDAGKAWMAAEFLKSGDDRTQAAFAAALDGLKLSYEPHCQFKQRVPGAIGIIRTGDATPFSNVILESS